jgi:hypothetical protein
VVLLGLLLALPSTAAARVVVADDEVCTIFVQRELILYARAATSPPAEQNSCGAAERRYGRVVEGRRRAVTGLPKGAYVPMARSGSSIGTDRRGRVVVSVTDGSRWWLYDIAGDVSRRVRPPASAGCRVSMLAAWHGRLAFGRSCATGSGADQGYFLLGDAGERRIADGPWTQGGSLALRRRTVAFAGIDDGDDVSVGRLADRGRSCPSLFNYGSVWGTTPRELWLRDDRILIEFGGLAESGSTAWKWRKPSLWEVRLGAPCSKLDAPTKLFDLPVGLGVQAMAIAGKRLYYADDTAIHERPLASFGSPG